MAAVKGKKEQCLCPSLNALPLSLSDSGTNKEGGTTGSPAFVLRGLYEVGPSGQFPLHTQGLLCETAVGPGFEEERSFCLLN